jgi:hypothetical protein
MPGRSQATPPHGGRSARAARNTRHSRRAALRRTPGKRRQPCARPAPKGDAMALCLVRGGTRRSAARAARSRTAVPAAPRPPSAANPPALPGRTQPAGCSRRAACWLAPMEAQARPRRRRPTARPAASQCAPPGAAPRRRRRRAGRPAASRACREWQRRCWALRRAPRAQPRAAQHGTHAPRARAAPQRRHSS